MFELTADIKNKIREYCQGSAIECCGIIYDNRVIPFDNIADDPINEFKMDVSAICQWPATAFYHSHNNSNDFSEIDIIVADKLQLISILYLSQTDEFKIYEPKSSYIPILDRPYLTGILDCMILAQDYYSRVLNIIIPEFDHPLRYFTISDLHKDLEFYKNKFDDDNNTELRDFYIQSGFVEVNEPLKLHDLILIKPSPDIKSAFGVAIYKGQQKVLCHLEDNLSEIRNYGLFFKQNTVYILRHQSLM